jgi:hypothetical protein
MAAIRLMTFDDCARAPGGCGYVAAVDVMDNSKEVTHKHRILVEKRFALTT